METIPAKSLLSRNKNSWWFGCDYNMNIYRGCSHGCLYCDSRSDCYRVENFDTVRSKADALRILRDELARKRQSAMVATGAMSDPYNPLEKKYQLSRHAAELMDAYEFGLAIATKSDLIVRDIDVFTSIKKHSPLLCKITITTTDDAQAAILEPYAPLPSARLAALKKLSSAGIYSGVLMMPILPHLQDSPENITNIITQSAEAGARFILPYIGVTMRAGQREYLINGLASAYPNEDYAQRYRAFGERYKCSSPRSKALWELFATTCDKHGLLYKMQDIVRSYRMGYGPRQLSLY